MALIIEDGTGLSTAEAYCDLTYLNAYLTKRGIDETQYTDAAKEAALYIGCNDFMQVKYNIVGEIIEGDQALKAPTDDVDLTDAATLRAFQDANAEAARLYLDGRLIKETIDANGQVQSESSTVGPITKSKTYIAYSGVKDFYATRKIDALMSPYIFSSSGGFVRW